jgi:O-antigen/teichoic acid export membrane protein
MIPKALISGGIWIGVAQGISRGGALLLTILVGRLLGGASLGAFAVLWTFFSVLIVVADWGQQAALTRRVARSPESLALGVGESFRILFWPALASATAMAGLGPLLAETSVWSALLLAMALPLLAVRNSLIGAYRALERWRWEAITALSDRSLMLLGAYGAILAGWRIEGVCAAVLLGQVIGTCIACVGLSGERDLASEIKRGFRGASASARRDGAYLMLAALSAVIYVRSDVLILGLFRSAEEVGSYAAASMLVMAAGLAPQVILAAWYPDLAKDPKQAKDRLLKAWFALAVLGLLEIGTGYFLGVRLVDWLYGLPVAALVACLLWAGEALNSLNYAGGVVLRAANRERRLVGLMAIAAVLNVATNLVIVPFYGASGAAATTFLAYGLIAFGHALGSDTKRPAILLVLGLAALGLCACFLTWAY